jgi:hypothetical protein
MSESVTVTGVDEAIARLRRVQMAAPAAAGTSMRAAGDLLAAVAAQEAPKRTGALAGSIHASGPYRGAETVSVRVATGKLSYAKITHWRQRAPKTRLPIRYTTPGTGAKFLFGPRDRLEASIREGVSAAVKTAVDAQ